MKIFKKNEHSLLTKVFGAEGKYYLTTSVLLFFDLNDPENLLTEQDLWKTVPELLGEKPILDAGAPKPRGEFLVAGSCFAPRGETRRASEIHVRVGGIKKTLHVYGNRYWKGIGEILTTISEAEPFREMPLRWEYAYGGNDFPRNPVGKGRHPVKAADGTIRRPLPNIEYPDKAIGSTLDVPPPAGLSPLDMMWEPRSKKTGSYDDKWKRERFPWFPDDMNYEFFNEAPEDQFGDYFKGSEKIEIRGMNKDFPVIYSQLPQRRIRCFVTKKKSLKPSRKMEDLFVDVKTNIDTVWLFPSVLRGIAVYRGTVEVLDDEYADVVRIFVATENMKEPEKTVEYYFEQQKKAMDLSVSIDAAPLDEARKKIADALKRFKQIPKEIEDAKKRAMGRAPRTPIPDPEDMRKMAGNLVRDSRRLVDRLEPMAQQMHAEHGRLVKVPLDVFDKVRKKISDAEGKINEAVDKAKQAESNLDKAQKKIDKELKAHLTSEQIREYGLDPEKILKPAPVSPFHDSGFPFICECRRHIEYDPEACKPLLKLGFAKRTTKRYWMGFNDETRYEDPSNWGVIGKSVEDSLILPPGFVLPRFDGPELCGIEIFPELELGKINRIIVPGSELPSLLLPAVGGNRFILVTPDDLTAIYMEQEAGDVFSAVSMATPDQQLGDDVSEALDNAELVLTTLNSSQLNDAGWKKWMKKIPGARALLIPDDEPTIFAAVKKGLDARAWVMAELPEGIAEEHNVNINLPEKGKPPAGSPLAGLALPAFDIKSIIEKMTSDVRAFHQPKFDELLKKQSEIEGLTKKALENVGHDAEKVLAASKNQPRMGFDKAADKIAQGIDHAKDVLRREGRLTKEAEAQLDEHKAGVLKMGRDGEKEFQEGLKKIEAGKKKAAAEKAKALAGEPPDELKKKLAEFGLHPDRIKKRTREDVIRMHEEGESLEGAVIAGVDLSGLDLSGANFAQAQLKGTDFSGSVLRHANFNQAIAPEANFSKAVLSGAVMEKGLFMKSLFCGARLDGANMHQAVMKEADLSEADLSEARLDWVILQKAKLKKANLRGIKAEMGVFTEAEAAEADFREAVFFKSLFRKTKLDKADFSKATLDQTMFMGAQGEQVCFKDANMNKSSMNNQTRFTGADFKGASLDGVCYRESNLSGSDFRGAVMREALLEACDLTMADFTLIPLQKTRITKCDLEGARLTAVNMYLGSLRKSRLVRTDLRASNLFAVDFYKSTIGETRFEQANLKRTELFNRTDILK